MTASVDRAVEDQREGRGGEEPLEPREAGARTVSRFEALPVGLVVGLIAAMCGIGGGLFVVPYLHLRHGLALRAAVGTALFFVLPTAVASTLVEHARDDSRLSLELLLPLAAGTLLGVQLGFSASKRVTPRRLQALFAVVLLIASFRLLFDGGGSAAAMAGNSWSVAASTFAVGCCGGFVAPLFGIGGGLVMVPGLALLVPGVDFATARASSLAVAILTAGRSAWLYRREPGVAPRLGLVLAIGAVAGAAIGVELVHLPGWAAAARRLFALILLWAAWRFARAARRAG